MWTTPPAAASLCVHRKTSVIELRGGSCPAKTQNAVNLTRTNELNVCIHSKTRAITYRSKTSCPRTNRPSSLLIRQSIELNQQVNQVAAPDLLPNTTVPVVIATTTTTTTTTTTSTPPTTVAPPAPTGVTTSTTTTSTTTTLPQVINLVASSQTINEGDSTTITPEFERGTASINQGIGSVTNNQEITVSPTSTTRYTLSVTEGITTREVYLTVYVNSLSITTEPASITVKSDQRALLSVVVEASGIASYEWYRNNTLHSTGASPSVSTTLEGDYKVVVTSTLNGVTRTEISQTATVTHHLFSLGSVTPTTIIGDNDEANLSVMASGNGSISYQWFYEGAEINNAAMSTYETSQAGTYHAIVTSTLNSHEIELRSSSITIIRNSVTITSQPADITFTSMDTARLSVQVAYSGNATITYEWFQNGQSLGTSTPYYDATSGGTYYVKVTSEREGTTAVVISSEVTVTEVAAPVATSIVLSSSSIASGSTLTITPTFSDGTGVITPGDIAVTSGNPITVNPQSTTTYTLTVTNAAGSSRTISNSVFVTTGSFVAAQNSATAERGMGSISVKLLNGKVLSVGNRFVTAVADLFDPDTNRFTQTGSMAHARAYANAVVLNDGRVLVMGGMHYTTQWVYRASAEIYDPATGTFTLTGSMFYARSNPAAVLLADGRVMVLGGYNSTNYHLNSTEIYNPATGVWSTGPSMNRARGDGPFATRLSDGRILIAGGYNSTNGVQKTAEVYNPSTNTFTLLADQMNLARVQASIVALPNGDALIVGGSNAGVPQGPIEVFHGATNTFYDLAAVDELDVPVFGTLISLLPNGLVAIFGGATGSAVEDRVYLYDHSTRQVISENARLGIPRYYATGVTLNDGRVLIIGGSLGAEKSAELYTP